MQVIVFGATGTIGRLAVRSMLTEGHHVTAFARRPDRLDVAHANLKRVTGDVLDPSVVASVMPGQDAAVIVLGSGRSLGGNLRSRGTTNVIEAMRANGVRRLICQSTLGAHESWSNLNVVWKRLMFGLLLRQVLRDHETQETLVRQSGLDWTLVRPSAFTDGPMTGRFHEGFGPDRHGFALKIARADVAAFLTRQLAETRYLGQAVAIST